MSGTEAFKLKKGVAIPSVLRMDNRRENRPLREAMEERYIEWIIDQRLETGTDSDCSHGMAFAVA